MAKNRKNNRQDRSSRFRDFGENYLENSGKASRSKHRKVRSVRGGSLQNSTKDIPAWVYKELNVSGWKELEEDFEQEYREIVRWNKVPFTGNVFMDFRSDSKMDIKSIRESLRARWMASNCGPNGKLWQIARADMHRKYGAKDPDDIGVPNGKKFREDHCCTAHEDAELFLYSDKFKNAFEKAVKIPLSNWRVMNFNGKKIERMEFMCKFILDGQERTMLGCFERRIVKNQFVQNGGSSIMLCGYFMGDNSKRFTLRRQDYCPPHPHKNRLVNGNISYKVDGGKIQQFALDTVAVKDTQFSHEHTFTLSQRLFTNLKFSVDCVPTDKSRELGEEYKYKNYDEMCCEFMKNKNLLMFSLPVSEIQKESVVKLAKKYCPVYDADMDFNGEIPRALRYELSPIQESTIRANKPPHSNMGRLEEIFGLRIENKKGKHYAKTKEALVKEYYDRYQKERENEYDQQDKVQNVAQSNTIVDENINSQGNNKSSKSTDVVKNLKEKHKKKKSNARTNNFEDKEIEKVDDIVDGMAEFRRRLKERKKEIEKMQKFNAEDFEDEYDEFEKEWYDEVEEMDEKDYDKEDNEYLDEIDSQDMYEEEYETPPEEYEELKSYELDKLYDELEDEYEQ